MIVILLLLWYGRPSTKSAIKYFLCFSIALAQLGLIFISDNLILSETTGFDTIQTPKTTFILSKLAY